jgi:hypothetical protein
MTLLVCASAEAARQAPRRRSEGKRHGRLHELAFGTFITPQNPRLEDVVGVAQLTERTGLDLVSFQDHPYQPAFLDTWTLLSWVAARTETRMNALIRARPRTVEELDRGSGVIDEAASAAGRDPREVRGS